MKKWLALLLVMLITVNVYAIDLKLTIDNSNMIIDGESKVIKAPVEENGMTLVPVRVITEAFGADVLWNDSEQSVTITKDDNRLWLAIDNKVADINGESIELLTAPKLLDDTTMVPIRIISEMLDCKVSYNDETREITITDETKANWTMDVPDKFLVDNRDPRTTIYYSEDQSQHIIVNTFKKNITDSLDSLVEEYSTYLKEKYNASVKTGERIEDGVRKAIISYTRKQQEITGTVQIFLHGNVLYVVETYAKGCSKEELDEITKTLKVEYITDMLPDEYDRNFIETRQMNGYSFNAPGCWEIEEKDDINSYVRDEVQGFEIHLESINYDTMNDAEMLEPYGLGILQFQYKVSDAFDIMCTRVFHNKDGMPLVETRTSESYTGGGPYTKYQVYSYPEIIKDYYKDKDVYIFDVDDKSIEYKTLKKDKEDVDKSRLTLSDYKKDYEKFKLLVKETVCYVFVMDNTLMIANCKVNNNYSYQHNRYIYDNIIKSFLELND